MSIPSTAQQPQQMVDGAPSRGSTIPTGARRLLDATALRFALVGSVNTAIDFGLFVGLSALGTPLLLANTASTSAGLVFSYFANRRFTFGVGARHDLRGILLFVAITGVGLWVVQPLVILGVSALLPITTPAAAAAALGKAAGIAVGLVWNFVWYRTVVFRGSPGGSR